MKPQNIILPAILLLLLGFSACREITVTTRINRDGTFTRIITVTGDSADVLKKTDLPFPVDDSWDVALAKDSTDSTRHIATYSKSFRNSDELNEEIRRDTSFYIHVNREVTVKKRFGFFFNYLTFSEVYRAMNPFTRLDYKDYLTEEDLQWVSGLNIPLTSADSALKALAQEKVDRYFAESMTAEIEAMVKEGIKLLNNPALDTSEISLYHDSLASSDKLFDIRDMDQIIEYYRYLSGNDSFLLLRNTLPPMYEDFARKMSVAGHIIGFEGYTEEAEMPGLITETNSSVLQGSKVGWRVDADAFLLRDFRIYAESRVVNRWAFILAGIVLLALMVLLVVKASR